MLRLLKIFIVSLATLTIIACSATPTSESTGQFLDSSAITAKVKAELIDKLGAKGFAVKVKTYKGQVQLSGFVNSALIKQHATVVASMVPGVKHVRNDLIIKAF